MSACKSKSGKRSILAKSMALPGAVAGGIFYRLSGSLFTPKPRFVCFPVTFHCNSRCQMCNIWKEQLGKSELDLKTIESVFSNPLFSKVERVVLHGGEPTLREDIAAIYEILLRTFPKLEDITLSTNGMVPRIVDKRMREILAIERPCSVEFTVTVSIDGLRASHEAIRGIPGSFDSAVATLKLLKKYQTNRSIKIDVITVIQPQNLEDLEKMMDLANENGVGLIFQPMMIDSFYGNSALDPRLRFSETQLAIYRDFISTHLAPGMSTRSVFWRNYLEMLDGGRRRIPCAYDRYVLSLYPTGEVLPCAKVDWNVFGNIHEKSANEIWHARKADEIRRRMRREVCATCDFYCGAEYSLSKEFFTYGMDVVKRSWKRSADD